jgi:signal transduction histidine kinase/ActR/RegA family two-component response regulator
VHSNGASTPLCLTIPQSPAPRDRWRGILQATFRGVPPLSLSVRLLLLVLLAVVPALCIEIYGEVELRASHRQEIRDEALRLVRVVAAEQERIDEGTRQLLIAFSEAAAIRAGDWDGCNETAKRVRAQIDGYVNIGIASNEGRILCAGIEGLAGVELRDNSLRGRITADTSLAIGNYQLGRITGRKILLYGIPWRDEHGEMRGFIWAALDLNWLSRHFADRFSSPDTTLLIADRDGTILARLPDPWTWVGRPIGEAYMPWLKSRSDGVAEAIGVDGEERIIAYSSLAAEPRGLYVGVGLAKAPLFARIDAASRQKALLISVACALALLAAWLGGDVFIRKPINKLLVAARRWQAGDYGARTGLAASTSELDKLGSAFDEMADAVEGRERDRHTAENALACLNAELERRVKQEVAEREQAQAQLLQAQKIEAVGQLTSGVAHDFNNLLAAVLGNLELLRGRVADPRAVQLLDGAARAAARGAKLTEQLLAFSRRHHLEPTPFDVDELIHGMSELLARTLAPSISVQRSLAPGLWPALADASQIEVALLNLAINARDAMPLGGTLLIETANLPAGDPRLPRVLAGDFVMIAVSDNGTGMSQEVKAKAFEPFFTTKDVGKGTGLGLSMVYGVARQFGGAAAIESEPGKGTTVALFLPRAGAKPALRPGAAVPEPQTAPRRGGRVLVVDDDLDVREVAVAALAELGVEATAVASGQAALDLVDRGAPIDLLIVDYAMPGMNGAEVIARARALLPQLPIILITGYAEAGLAADLPEDVQLLRKPFRVSELLARVGSGIGAGARAERSNILPLRQTQKPG